MIDKILMIAVPAYWVAVSALILIIDSKRNGAK